MEMPIAASLSAPKASGASHFPAREVLLDRALGVVLGGVLGDALGRDDGGRWGANTSMTISMLQSMVEGSDLSTDGERRMLVSRWIGWYRRGGQGVDASTLAVFDRLAELASGRTSNSGLRDLTGKPWFDAMRTMSEFMGPSGSSGSIARVTPFVLAYLDPGAESALVEAVTELTGLTHPKTVGEAASLWALAVRHAIITGEADTAAVRAQLEYLPEDGQHAWEEYIDETEQHLRDLSIPLRSDIGRAHVAVQHALVSLSRGFDVQSTLQAAANWQPPSHAHNPAATARTHPAAIALRSDKASVAAIAGQLAGAKYGASSIPTEQIAELHGFPNDMRADDLKRLVDDILERYDRWYQ
ncbi:putative ribosylglycohydrolase [Trichosporon asahii var. asahii CBS 8904]|uniref:ADP-ribosylhydrolase ARH3 n=1 Tax=Trichosporon asahii var. asahii (strain CBS 8904) TaxID=1220162 RepID=K1VGF7_TRIAC|nr:putative ribosylglycohydrolase [Trichosporon asahii var. asahii CBS 8904]